MTETVTDGLGIPESSGEGVIRRIPTEADFLMAYSVIPGMLVLFFSSRTLAFVLVQIYFLVY